MVDIMVTGKTGRRWDYELDFLERWQAYLGKESGGVEHSTLGPG
jgi:hypothetical protein